MPRDKVWMGGDGYWYWCDETDAECGPYRTCEDAESDYRAHVHYLAWGTVMRERERARRLGAIGFAIWVILLAALGYMAWVYFS